jgi:hypothetical protein
MRHAYQVIIATTWHYILAKPNPRLLKYQLLTAHTHAATVEDQHDCPLKLDLRTPIRSRGRETGQ